MIVKCQRSVFTTMSGPQLMFYNKARDWFLQCDATEDWLKHFGPTTSPADSRFFAEVRWPVRAEPPIFVKRLPEQHW